MEATDSDIKIIGSDIKLNAGTMNTYFVISLILMIIVMSITGLLWFMKDSAQREIAIFNDKILVYTKQIEVKKQNNAIVAYDIVLTNEKQIAKDIEKSQAQKYITEVISLGKKYKIMFSGFSYNGDSITTTASTVGKDANSDSIAIVSGFIKDFRTGNNKIFNLDPITSVTGDTFKRMFSVGFKVIK